jgi:uncharacterized protein YjbI with pentapeptide repeats
LENELGQYKGPGPPSQKKVEKKIRKQIREDERWGSRWVPSQKELEEILRKHEKWLEPQGDSGQKADLSKTVLWRADLSEANLRGANLSEANGKVDLSMTSLQRANLSDGKFDYADLSGANLQEADLTNVNLYGANLSGGNLREVDLTSASLENVDLSKANAQGADLSGAFLRESNLSEAILRNANLSKAILPGADLSGAILKSADLSRANLAEGDLSGASLWNANLSEVVLNGADLKGANLWSVNLSRSLLIASDLSEAFLSGADLSGANLRGAILSQADLEYVDFTEAYLVGGDLSGANLMNADLCEANLRDADFSDTYGLQVQAIAQADTSNATLPEDIAEFDGLTVVEEASRGARKLFISLGLACAYAVLAVSTARSDATGEEVLTLPFIEVNISPWGFHLAMPLLLTVGFGYLHLQLQRVWEEISRLPAIFPDGKAIDQKIHPWLITGLVRGHFPYLRENPIPLFRLQELVVIVLAWGIVPVTQAYFVGSFVAQFPEYAYQSGFGAALVAFTTIGAVVSYQTAKAHLRGEYEGLYRPFGDEEDESIRKQPNWHTAFLSVEWTLLIFALWIGWTFVL